MPSILQRTCLALACTLPACCVAATTRVRTPRGHVPADDLVPGDLVLSLDVATGELLTSRVVAVRRAARECLALRWPGGDLVCTPDHPLWSPETRTYRPASDWVTGPARTLLHLTQGGPREVTVTAADAFAGLHVVLDLTLDRDPHNFLAADILVHNKSPVTYSANAEVDGPDVALGGMGDAAAFRVFACVDGEDATGPHGYGISVGVEWTVKTSGVQTDNIPAELGVDVDDQTGGGGSPVPSDGEAGVTKLTACSEGALFVFRRADASIDGEVTVSWNAYASIGEFTSEDEADRLDITVEIVPADVPETMPEP